ncbi:hypothetical protein INR49_028514 [Caranx melampygus]|nr:hypothetical protein INR49_028514 [Caranx melampygus]
MLSQEFFQKLRLPDLDDVSQYIRGASTPMLVSMGAVAIATTYYLATRPKPLPSAFDLRLQSVEVPGGDLARRSVLQRGDGHMTHIYDDGRTMYEFFLRGARVSNNGPCLGSRKPNQPYEWLSYSEWTMSELACYTYSLVSVPLYDTLGTEAIAYIIDKASISTIVCDVVDKVNLVLDCVQDRKHSVKTIVLMETPDADLVSRGQQAGIHILSLQEMEAIGKANHQPPVPPQPEDMAVICFTSGTTGNPKGAMLTHGNIVSNCSAFIKMTEGVMIVHGARIGFFQGDIRRLSDDLNTLKPTVFPVVPRLLNRMYDKIFGQANTSLKRWVLGFAYRRKEAEMQKGIIRRDSIWDRLIFRKVQASLGGRVRLMITGAAPISPTVLTFLRAAVGCQFYEGYGQTECTAGCTLTVPGDWSAGHVGAPLPCNLVKLVDVPEMNYLAVNGEGENGTLKIVDRKKHIFKLAQGEYIAPEKIENIYIRSDAVAQVFVHGDSLQACLVAVVVPDPDFLSGWTKRALGLDGSYQELCSKAEVKAAILEDMLRLGKEGASSPSSRAIYIHTEMFSVENGLLTPTMKAKRNEMRQHFRPQIEELYAGIKIAKKGRRAKVPPVPPDKSQDAPPQESMDSPNLSLIDKASFLEGLQVNYGNPLHSTAMDEDLNTLEDEQMDKGKTGGKAVPETTKTTAKQHGAAVKRKETGKENEKVEGEKKKKRRSAGENVKARRAGEERKKKKGEPEGEREESDASPTPQTKNKPTPKAKHLVGKKPAKRRSAGKDSDTDTDSGQQNHRRVLSSDEEVGDDTSWAPSPKKPKVYSFGRTRKSTSDSSKSRKSSSDSAAEKVNTKKQRERRGHQGGTDLEVVLDAFLDFCDQYKESVESKAVKHSIDSFSSSVKEQLLEKISSNKEIRLLRRENAKVGSLIRTKTQRLLDAKHELMRAERQVWLLQKEKAELKLRLSDLRRSSAFLHDLRELNQQYLEHRHTHRKEKETYGASSLPALLLETKHVQTAENQLRSINKEMEKRMKMSGTCK